jgi:hypothetical protein
MDSIRVSEAPDSGSIPDEATRQEARKKEQETRKEQKLFSNSSGL